jgi:DNA mismatch endonuclease (patch repair protein)
VTDKLTRSNRSNNMAAIRSSGMKPEKIVRSLVHNMGYRYRLHAKDLPGKPDLVFRSRKKVVFVHGCFWHQHSKPSCKDGRAPKSNLNYWAGKLARNVERDLQNLDDLNTMGWEVLVLWECEILKDLTELSGRIHQFLE